MEIFVAQETTTVTVNVLKNNDVSLLSSKYGKITRKSDLKIRQNLRRYRSIVCN